MAGVSSNTLQNRFLLSGPSGRWGVRSVLFSVLFFFAIDVVFKEGEEARMIPVVMD